MAKKRKPQPTLHDQLRRHVLESGVKPIELARQLGVNRSVVSKFQAGGRLRSDVLENLVAVLGLELVQKATQAKRVD
jgi:hypothetical protein